jgi:membrane protein YqaA with SNARE-associated domain
VGAFFRSIFDFFLSPLGVLLLGGLDSSMLFFLPAAIDTAVVVMVARHRNWFWLFPLLATAGSVIGATVTYFVGRKIGEAGLERWMSKSRLAKVRKKVEDRQIFAVALAAVLPPPFPLTPFVLTGGALGINKQKFYATLASMRMVRFGAEAVLALLYGRQILVWMKSDTFEYLISTMLILALAGTAVSIYQVVKRVR